MSTSVAAPDVLFRLPSVEALRAALPSLEKRRAFVPEATGLALRQRCVLVLLHPEAGSRLSIAAEVVWVQTEGATKGVGVELRDLDVERLRAFVENTVEPVAPGPNDE